MKISTLVSAILLVPVFAGCSTDSVHRLMRVRPVPLSDFLPGNERLVRQPDTFPFHYLWVDTNAVVAADFQHVYIAPVDVTHLREGNGYDRLRDKLIGLDDDIDELGEFGRQAFVVAFSNNEARTEMKLVNDPKLPHTLVLEPAITAFVPTRAEISAIGTVAEFAVPGVGIVSDFLSDGSIAVECRVRDSGTDKVVAMFADTESDPNALLGISKFTYTSTAKINLKRIADHTVECCAADDRSQLRRAFPFEFISTPWDSDLDD